MNYSILKSALLLGTAAAIFAAPSLAIEAQAKVKEQKFHFVEDKFGTPAVMTMKFKNGKWQWIDSDKSFKKQVKLKAKSSKKRITNAGIALAAPGSKNYNYGIWNQPKNYKAFKIEELVTFTINKKMLSSSQNSAATICQSLGGDKKVTMGMGIPAKFYAHSEGRSNKYANLQISVICMPRVKPAEAKIAQMNFYTVPARPVCNKPVSIVADFKGTHPVKVDFTLVRNDGAKQKNSTTLTYAKPLSNGRWSKTYTFNKTTHRRYQIILAKQPMASNWVDVKVSCRAAAGKRRLGKVKS